MEFVITSAGLADRIQMCNAPEKLELASGHMPIGTMLDLTVQMTAPDP